MKNTFLPNRFHISATYCMLTNMILIGLTYGAATITDFGVYIRDNYHQNSSAGPNPSTYSYFYAEVLGSDLGDLSVATYTDPGSNVRNLGIPPSEARATDTGLFTDTASRDAAYPPGNYTFTLDSESVTLAIASDIFTNTPEILGGAWSGVRLQVSDAGYTFNFNAPTNADYVRLHIYQQGGTFKNYYYEGNGSTTSFTVQGADLELGLNYGAALDFINLTDTKTGFSGATGRAGYMTRNEFQFAVVSVPEPTSILLFGAAGVIGILRRNRR